MLNPSRPLLSTTARLGTIAVFAVVLPVALVGQNAFSTISGSITDPSDAVLPGVFVTAMDTERGVRHEVRTTGAGRFELVGLPQGAYTLEVDVPGFETFQEKLRLSGQDVNRDITLQVGTLQETIAVTSPGPNVGPPTPAERYPPRPPYCGAGPGSAAGAAPGGAIRVGGQIRTPRKLFHVAPIYPEGSPAGTVKMNAVIGIDGLVKETTVTNDAPPALAQSAVYAVQRWEFDPTLLNCAPVEVRMTVLVDYR
jgi:Carboxypeptidase regulatory-like domain/Gram-negative bacterial TonB protein C-terminal